MDRLFKYLSYATVVLLFILAGFLISQAPVSENMEVQIVGSKLADDFAEVKLCGEVKNEGIYTVTKGMSLYDVLYMAGGLTENADLSMFNPDSPITGDCTFEIPVKAADSIPAMAEYAFSSDGIYAKCNINTASAKQLAELPGIGDVVAGRIVAYRAENGSFKSIDEITKVKGIGEKTFLKFKDYITVGGK